MHEALAQLFRNRPRLAPELLERALGLSLPRFANARIEEATFADLHPAEYRADLVVLLADDAPVLTIVVEVQLARDPRKHFSWPMYVAGLRARFKCPTCLLVIAASDEVAAWARESITIGPANSFMPLVVGPESVPLVVSVEEATRAPELFVLSVMAHGRDNETTAHAMLPAAARVVRAVDIDQAVLYFDLIEDSLGPAAAKAFEELMDLENYEFKSAYLRNLIARGESEGRAKGMAEGRAKGMAEGKAEGIAEGKAEGIAEGKAEGIAEGKAEGIAAGKAESILLVLRARGLAVSLSAEARIRTSNDLAQLDRWIGLAATADAVDALFEE